MIEAETLAFIGTSDLSGLLRGVSVPWAALEGVMERGVVLPGHVPSMSPRGGAIQGAADLLLLPDPATRAYIPAEGAPDMVLLLGDLLELDGAPWACCPRYFLRRGLAALHAEFGLTVRARFTQEFGVVGAKPGRSFAAARAQAAACGRLLAAMRGNGLIPEVMHPGDAIGVFEAGAAAMTGVAAADQATVLRVLIESVSGGTLGGVRIGVGLVDRFGQSAMADPSGEHGLSDDAEHLVAGLVHHLPALASVVAPQARLLAGKWAELAVEGRPGALRLRSETDDEGGAVPSGVELSFGDAGASPYLALGAAVWAGLDGLRQHRRLAEQQPRKLPSTAGAALDVFQESVSIAEWFGMELREQFLRYGRAEAVRLG